MKRVNIAGLAAMLMLSLMCFFPVEDHTEVILIEKTVLNNQMEALQSSWNHFFHCAENAKVRKAAWKKFMISYKKAEWLLSLLTPAEKYNWLNNSKYWVWQDSMARREYDEAGVFQQIERTLFIDTALSKTDLSHRDLNLIDSWLTELCQSKEWLHLSQSDYFFAWVMDDYRQYFLHLTGYDRLNLEMVLPEYKSNILSRITLLKSISEEQREKFRVPVLMSRYEAIAELLEESNYDQLDRATLLKTYLQPSWSHLSKIALDLSGAEVPVWAAHFQWEGQSPFSAQWLEPRAFRGVQSDINEAAAKVLGELLFFDPLLSGNGKRTCGSCHKPQKAFADGRQTSLGYDFTVRLKRNAPSLVNTVFHKRFGHDNYHHSIEEQIMSVVEHPQEFRSNMDSIVERLRTSKEYEQLFGRAFPENSRIDSANVVEALGLYTASIISFDTEFDQYMRGEIQKIDTAIIVGFNLFMGKAQCGSCHFAPLFSGLKPPTFRDQEYHSHGVTTGVLWDKPIDLDWGIADFKGKDYKFFFRTPGLRNLQYTAPYMHNGIFYDMNGALGFIFEKHERAYPLADFPSGAINFTDDEKEKLKAFLNSLNDHTIDQKYKEGIELPLTNGSVVPERRRSAGVY